MGIQHPGEENFNKLQVSQSHCSLKSGALSLRKNLFLLNITLYMKRETAKIFEYRIVPDMTQNKMTLTLIAHP